MTAPAKHIVFDVVGTCVSYDAFHAGVRRILGPKLLSAGLSPQLFAFAWMESAEREFAYLSISSRYVPFKDVFKALFYRILWMSGVQEPRGFATEAQRDEVLATYSDLELRDGVEAAFGRLREEGFTVWCLTTGDVARVRGYFLRAGVDMPVDNFVSCDLKGVAKPALEAYRPVLERFGDEDQKWFAAAHMWDVSAARLVGFRGAYCTVYEKESCSELFGGDMEVMTDSLPELADKVIDASK